MRLSLRTAALVPHVVVLLASNLVDASGAFWLQPSTTWLGIDGTWSTFEYLVGAPGQRVYLTVNTALSEFWVVENTGCTPNALCTTARGGVFDIAESRSWTSLGEWELPLPGGNGDYGLETLVTTNTVHQASISVDNALVAGINDTDFFVGYIGIGVTQTAFDTDTSMGHVVTNPYISQLAQTYGYIPSHSYGYTAGARYIGPNGTPASLTLGGYDPLRFESHDTSFNLNLQTLVPSVRLRGLTAELTDITQAPVSGWNSTSRPLVAFNDSIIATIDTSNPYLWLPETICDRFAAALGLIWSDVYGVYVFGNSTLYNQFLDPKSLSFVFTLSSYDNSDNFGQPLDTPGVVNVTSSSAAFALTLQYPYRNLIGYGDPAVPYFPLKRSNSSSQAVIGRVFMQEAYMVTRYDEETFAVYQASFPDNPYTNYSTVDIPYPPNSPYPAFIPKPASTGLTTGQMVGIIIASLIVGGVSAFISWCYCLRRRRGMGGKDKDKDTPRLENEFKDSASTAGTEPPASPVTRILSVIRGGRPRRPRRPTCQSMDAGSTEPAEVEADAAHGLYELEVPMEPVEMHSPHNIYSPAGFLPVAAEGFLPESSYEAQRRQIQRQLQGPVPAYTPPEGKTEQDISPVAHYRPSDHENPSPVSSPSYGHGSNTMPSPITPHTTDWTLRYDFPSSSSAAGPPPPPPIPSPPPHTTRTVGASTQQSPCTHHNNTFEPSTISRASSSRGSAHHSPPVGVILPPAPSYQRTPIDPSRVICLGPLPENVRLPHHRPSIPQLILPDLILPDLIVLDQHAATSTSPVSPGVGSTTEQQSDARPSMETLGSNYTVEEETRMREEDVTTQLSPREATSPLHSPRSLERIDTGLELVHVPQLPDKRYSWEEEG